MTHFKDAKGLVDIYLNTEVVQKEIDSLVSFFKDGPVNLDLKPSFTNAELLLNKINDTGLLSLKEKLKDKSFVSKAEALSVDFAAKVDTIVADFDSRVIY